MSRRHRKSPTGPLRSMRPALKPWRALIISALLCTNVHADDTAQSLVEQLQSAIIENDTARLTTLLAPEMRWTVHASRAAIPFAGAYRGVDGVLDYHATRARYAVIETTAPQIDAAADKILVRRQLRGTVPTTGGVFHAEFLAVMHLADNRIQAVDEYLDSQAVADAFIPADSERGKAWFTSCAGCHGNAAEGNAAMNAPNLTGQSSSYLVRQLRHFSAEIRGGVTDDYGWQMNGRAKALPGDRAWRDVIAYIGELPVAKPMNGTKKSTNRAQANAEAGKRAYAACVACHGEFGEGNPAVDGPALRPLEDWYLARQLHAFRSGDRGKHPADIQGQQMRPFAANLTDADVANVIAYLSSLNRGE